MVRLLRHFRKEIFLEMRDGPYPNMRWVHAKIAGNLGRKGVRLTELADRAELSLAACNELVNELEDLGYLARHPDPSDGRAKLIRPTAKGGHSQFKGPVGATADAT